MSKIDLNAVLAQKQMEENAPVSQEQVAEDISDNVLDGTAEAINTTETEFKNNTAPGSLKRKWVEAMSFMAKQPVSYGAIAGSALAGIFGGSQAGAASIPTAMKFQELQNKNYNAEQDRMLKLAQMEQEKAIKGENVQAPSSFSTKEGNPVVFDRKTGKFYSDFANKVEVNPKDVVSLTALESERKQKRADENLKRRDRSLDLQLDRFFDKQSEDGERKRIIATKAIENNPEFKLSEKVLGSIPEVRATIEEAYANGGTALAKLGITIAKSYGEVGAMTERDVTRYIQDPSVWGTIRDTLTKWKSGKLTGVTKESLERLIDIAEKVNIAKQEDIVNKVGKRYSTAAPTDIPKDFAQKAFTADKPNVSNEINAAKAWIANELKKPLNERSNKLSEVVKKVKQMEGK